MYIILVISPPILKIVQCVITISITKTICTALSDFSGVLKKKRERNQFNQDATWKQDKERNRRIVWEFSQPIIVWRNNVALLGRQDIIVLAENIVFAAINVSGWCALSCKHPLYLPSKCFDLTQPFLERKMAERQKGQLIYFLVS
jgi:hypothetical protein